MTEKERIVYLAGPMRGCIRYNFDTFIRIATQLRDTGLHVISPAEHDLEMGFNPDLSLEDQDFDIQKAMAWDIEQVLACDALYLLPGWRDSQGAMLEHDVAYGVGKVIYEQSWDNEDEFFYWRVPPEHYVREKAISVLEEAAALTGGDRHTDYGHPLDDFNCTAQLWTAWLRHKYDHVGWEVPSLQPEDVGWLMSLLKHSREANRRKRDNLVDVCGYVRTVEMCHEEEDRRAS